MKLKRVMSGMLTLLALSVEAQMPPPGFPQQQPYPQQIPPQFQPMQRRGQPQQPLDMGRGQRLYNMHCASCHGNNGTPTVPNAPNFFMRQGLDKPDFEIMQSLKTGTNVRTGKNHVPPFMGVLQDQDLMEIIQYTRIIR